MTGRFLAVVLLAAASSGPARAVDDPPPAPEAPADAGATNELLKVPPPEERKIDGLPEAAPPPPPPAGDAAETAAPVDAVVPEPFPLDRYARLWEKSPFQLESVAPPQESAGLAQQFALTGIAQISGEPIAFVLERATQLRHMLDRKTNTAGLSLVQVDVQPKYADSTVTIRRGGEVGVIKFDLAAAAPQPPAGPPQVAPVFPGQPPQVNHGVPAQLPPGVVPAVPNPAANAAQVVPGQPANVPPPRVIRRRATVPATP